MGGSLKAEEFRRYATNPERLPEELLALPEVGGALVGGASLSAESFLAIVLAAAGPGEE